MSRIVKVGSIELGGNNRVAVQTMCNTRTMDIDATVLQINQCVSAGADIVRIAVTDHLSAVAISSIKQQVSVPIVADIHFDYRLAVDAMENGADKIRINPGNLDKKHLATVVNVAKERNVPIRVGVNGGSLEARLQGGVLSQALVESALTSLSYIEKLGYNNLVVAVKCSNVATCVEANRLLATQTDYPIHVGITESGSKTLGIAKSFVGIGSLLLDGIGDTIRISLTDNPVEEVLAGRQLLRAVGLDKNFVEVISCPTCGRTKIDLIKIVSDVEDYVRNFTFPLKVAVMGCVVNGPGEAKSCDIGIAGGDEKAVLFKKGKVVGSCEIEQAVKWLKSEISEYAKQCN